MNRTMKVALACFIGTALGIITMLGINPKLWVLGLVAGFFGGYMSYEYKTVLRAVPVAWHRATSWRPDRVWWRAFLKILVEATNVGTVAAFFLVVLFTAIAYFSATGEDPVVIQSILGFAVGSLILFPLMFGLMVLTNCDSAEEMEIVVRNLSIVPTPRRLYFQLLPVWFAKGVWWLIKQTPEIVMFMKVFTIAVGLFLWHLFKLIHSEERLLCGIDAVIGVAVCHYSGNNVLLGLAFGVVLGVLSFEILSIRVFKLVPAEASILHRIR